jgi:ATP-dependent DNA helicase RecG
VVLGHRDFSNRSSYISVTIFDDRLEIWNNGTLPSELKVDDLKKKHKIYSEEQKYLEGIL